MGFFFSNILFLSTARLSHMMIKSHKHKLLLSFLLYLEITNFRKKLLTTEQRTVIINRVNIYNEFRCHAPLRRGYLYLCHPVFYHRVVLFSSNQPHYLQYIYIFDIRPIQKKISPTSAPMSVIFYIYFLLLFLAFCSSWAAISASRRFFSALTWTISSASFTSTSSRVFA